MGVLQLSDPTGQYEAVLFSETLGQYRDLLEPGQSVILLVSAEERPEGINVRVQSAEPLGQAADGLQRLRVYLRDDSPLPSLAKQLGRNGGKGEVSLVVLGDGGGREVELRLPGGFAVSPELAGAMRAIKGVEQVELV